jgi:hypothetical protein
MKYEEVPERKRNLNAARSAANMRGGRETFALRGHVVDGDSVESSVFQIVEPYLRKTAETAG